MVRKAPPGRVKGVKSLPGEALQYVLLSLHFIGCDKSSTYKALPIEIVEKIVHSIYFQSN